jgi:O-antigen ligase
VRPQLEAIAVALLALLVVVLVVRDQGGYFPTSWGWTALALLGVLGTWLVVAGRTDGGRLDLAFLCALLLFTGWVALSIVWSVDRPRSVLELERSVVLLAGCSALLVVAGRRTSALVAPALLAAVTAVCGYSLATRLDPSAGSFAPGDSTAGYRLFEPVGYWNALGGFAALGAVLALGLATDAGARRSVRTLGAVALVVLPLTLFFTFSRGAWLALAGGFLVLVAWSPHRLRVIAQSAVLALAPAIAVIVASRSPGLTEQTATFGAAQDDGQRLVWIVIALAALSVAFTVALTSLEDRVHLRPRPRRAVAVALLFAVIAALGAGVVREGGPVSLVRRGYDSFVDPTPRTESANLNSRLIDLNSNGRAQLWSVAIDSLDGRWLTGTGAGGFERTWERSPKANQVVRDAHGLYVETLSELGVIGLALLVLLLGLPLAAGVRRRGVPLVPGLAAAYATFLFHNAVDWDWELAGVTLTGLFLGCLLLVARRDGSERPIRGPVRAVLGVAVLGLAAFAFVAAVGNGALARARTANREHRYPAAAAAATTARSWMPWSPEPLKALGQAQLQQGEQAAARASFRKAIAIDRNDWQAWLDLAASVDGRRRRAAVARARELYPTSPEIAEFEAATRRSTAGSS